MRSKRELSMLSAGILMGSVLIPTANAAAQHLIAAPSSQQFYLDGQQISLEAYTINGSNYVKLDEISEAAGLCVIYDAASNSVYLGKPPATQATSGGTVTLPADGSQYIPQAGDRIACSDNTVYTITDVSRWNGNAFSAGPLGALPTPTCDWSKLPQPELPAPEVRHFLQESGDYLFVRNLYETRRMLYTLYNAIGSNPETWQNGALLHFSSGEEKVRISLTIDPSVTPEFFWPWRESELVNDFNSCPSGFYSMEAWDVYRDDIFQRTEYNIYRR